MPVGIVAGKHAAQAQQFGQEGVADPAIGEAEAEAGELVRCAEAGGAQPALQRHDALAQGGIAQAQQGKKAEARATFGQVGGARVPVAKMWAAYVESRA